MKYSSSCLLVWNVLFFCSFFTGAQVMDVTIHYHRVEGDYSGWGLHLWGDSISPEEETTWDKPKVFEQASSYGYYTRVMIDDATKPVFFIIHRDDEKDPGPDMSFTPEKENEVWVVQGKSQVFLSEAEALASLQTEINLYEAKALWQSQNLVTWPTKLSSTTLLDLEYFLYYGDVSWDNQQLQGERVELPIAEVIDSTVHLDSSTVEDYDKVLQGHIVVVGVSSSGKVLQATAIQTAGILDDVYYYPGNDLGVTFTGKVPTFKLWAPTARSVRLHFFANALTDSAQTTRSMNLKNGVWILEGESSWYEGFYLYEVEVFSLEQKKIVQNLVTDPYSASLSVNSTKSHIMDLADSVYQPDGWLRIKKKRLQNFTDISLYELHVRDFSIQDDTVLAEYRGKYSAFTQKDSQPVKHLAKLAAAGVTHLHLLPVFDIATIEEDSNLHQKPDIAPGAAPDSTEQQSAVTRIKDQDGYNWGYDPFHYGVPEGSYAVNPTGGKRILEFREMVKSLNEIGLQVIMDVVYNHTAAAGLGNKSVFDKIVPGYYYRLSNKGHVQSTSCCPDTASEHKMMEKLMIDTMVRWAKDYKIDGFRFDLMGHHTTDNLQAVKKALRSLTVEKDGVDGSKIYLYGEGWQFGSLNDVAPDKAFHQGNSYGLGVGTFNDRIRDGIRGGGAFHHSKSDQGFATGLFYDYNQEPANSETSSDLEEQRRSLLGMMDIIRVGLTGNLRDYVLMNHEGNKVKGSEVHYKGSFTGYTKSPEECINYVSAHDNYTLWDQISAKAPFQVSDRKPETATTAERVRMQNMAISLMALGQGIPFFHAGIELLRSKSGDGDSYNSGDWFNRLDYSYKHNNWGVGLPPAEKNYQEWDFWKARLGNLELQATEEEILTCRDHFLEMIQIRYSSPLFRLTSLEEIQAGVRFLNSERGKEQIPGCIVMLLSNKDSSEEIVTFFNATREEVHFSHPTLREKDFQLHPQQQKSKDEVIREGWEFQKRLGQFKIPPRSTIVFVSTVTD